MSNLVKLAQDIQDMKLRHKKELDAKIAEFNQLAGAEETAPAVQKKATAPKKKTGGSGSKKGGPYMTDLVQQIISQNPEGIKTSDICTAVASAIEKGEYETTSPKEKWASLVSQALNKLKSKDIVRAEKKEGETRSVYTLVEAA